MKKYILIWGWVLFLLSACSSVSETPPTPEFKPDALITFGDKVISVWDLIGKSVPRHNEPSEEMRVTLQYLQEKALTVPALALYNIRTDTLLYAPHFNIKETDILTEPVLYIRQDTLPLTAVMKGVKIKQLENIADFEYVLPYTGFNYEVEITFQNVFLKGTTSPLVVKEKVSVYNQNGVRHKENAAFSIDLSQGNRLIMKTKVILPKGASLAEPQTVSLLVKSLNIKLQKAVGYFPVPPLQLDSNNLKMNLNILSDLSNAFEVSVPKYYLLVKNKGFGLPAKVEDLQLTAKNFDATRSAVLQNDVEPFFDANLDDRLRVDTFVYTSDNSNLLEFLNLPPYGNVNYTGTIVFNPEGNTGIDNIIYADGLAEVDSYIEVPLVMKGNSLLYADTLKDIRYSSGQFTEAKLTVSSSTDIPFILKLKKINFYKEEGILQETLEFNEQLENGKTLTKQIVPELLSKFGEVHYGVAEIEVYPSLDVLSIRQNAGLKINYILLGESQNKAE